MQNDVKIHFIICHVACIAFNREKTWAQSEMFAPKKKKKREKRCNVEFGLKVDTILIVANLWVNVYCLLLDNLVYMVSYICIWVLYCFSKVTRNTFPFVGSIENC